MKIQKVGLPPYSVLFNQNFDYCDSYTANMTKLQREISPVDVAKAFFTSAPKLVGHLFEFRNRIVSIIGLKTGENVIDKETALANFKGNPGERLGLFSVFERTENEMVLGEDDKHLNFRVSLMIRPVQNELIITTTVKFHNLMGRLYFLPVKPFHQVIVPKMLKGIISELEKNKPKVDLAIQE